MAIPATAMIAGMQGRKLDSVSCGASLGLLRADDIVGGAVHLLSNGVSVLSGR